MKINFRDFLELLLLPVMCAGVYVLYDLNKNINALNVQMAVVIERNSAFQNKTAELESRLKEVENKVFKRL